MSATMGILPEKRLAEATIVDVKRSRITESPEDSHPIDCLAQGKVAGDNHKVTGEVSDSDDDMYFDSPGSFGVSTWDPVNGASSWDAVNGWQPKRDHIPALRNNNRTWNPHLDFCVLCKSETGHLGYECPYRCEEIFENFRCWKKVHHEDKHDYGYPSEPCADCENTEFGCDEHCF